MRLAPRRRLSLSAARRGVAAQPVGQGVFGEVAGGHRQHGQHAVGVAGVQGAAVELQEQLDGDKGGALVAVDEGVVARNAPAVGGGQRGDVGLAVGGQVLGAAIGAATLGWLFSKERHA